MYNDEFTVFIAMVTDWGFLSSYSLIGTMRVPTVWLLVSSAFQPSKLHEVAEAVNPSSTRFDSSISSLRELGHVGILRKSFLRQHGFRDARTAKPGGC